MIECVQGHTFTAAASVLRPLGKSRVPLSLMLLILIVVYLCRPLQRINIPVDPLDWACLSMDDFADHQQHQVGMEST